MTSVKPIRVFCHERQESSYVVIYQFQVEQI